MRFVGVDGCRLGWVAVALDGEGGWGVAMYEGFEDLWSVHQNAKHILVDVPIGLRTDGTSERLCDKEARRVLGSPRGSSVFPAPCRAALKANNHGVASEVNRRKTGRGLSIQSWAIMPKIDEVDRLLRTCSEVRMVVREVHPEVLFWALNEGEGLVHKKKSREGYEERLELLQRLHPHTDHIISHGLSRWKRSEVARDDILDALAAAVTAELGQNGFQTIPEEPEMDSEGIRMEMVYIQTDRVG